MQKLTKLGFGQIVTKEDMKRDNILPVNQCSNVFLKPHISTVNKDVFQMCSEELTKESYVNFFNNKVDEVTVKIIQNITRIGMLWDTHKLLIILEVVLNAICVIRNKYIFYNIINVMFLLIKLLLPKLGKCIQPSMEKKKVNLMHLINFMKK